MMRQIALALATLVVTLIAAPAARAGTPVAGFSDTAVATGLASPTAVAFLPDGRLLVTQKGGALRLVDAGVATTLVTIPVCSASEMGLLGIALDPDFGSNGFVYLYRTNQAPGGCGSAVGPRQGLSPGKSSSARSAFSPASVTPSVPRVARTSRRSGSIDSSRPPDAVLIPSAIRAQCAARAPSPSAR
jgi:hypothetical protein